MAEFNNQDQKFIAFIFGGLDHGIDSIRNFGGPLIPFIMTQSGDKKELKRFVTEKYEDGIIAAENTLKSMTIKPDFALIAFDGFINWEEKKYDAIIVHAFDKTQDEGFKLCQRYIPKENEDGIEPIGNSALLGKSHHIIT
ncbi:hypothetical protein [Formosa sp. L2A11]|uniref:hypothetical protein n=1 Tax=Formosa sp. L2A11 TaxID=2686363 RepID=UPI00131BED68|nr:hypothetical protein [Formosa sp. L2A11]